jgi:hypothetical protein
MTGCKASIVFASLKFERDLHAQILRPVVARRQIDHHLRQFMMHGFRHHHFDGLGLSAAHEGKPAIDAPDQQERAAAIDHHLLAAHAFDAAHEPADERSARRFGLGRGFVVRLARRRCDLGRHVIPPTAAAPDGSFRPCALPRASVGTLRIYG